ncbi:MAG: HAMP domain-containing histidine kinase [Clostridiales bacterium]|jgi:signal transduction histidine kinase|nr:HAMP domain-containing histidine kinase [Clostridiales bacterium]
MYQDYSQINDMLIQKIMDDNKRITSMFIHELRNPLSLIKGTLQYIEMKHQEVKEYKYWSLLPELITDMEHLMTDASLLNSSTSLNINSTNLLALIQVVVDNYSPQADYQEKLLTFKHTPECESLCSSYPCDSDKIKQVLSNLLKNALEATEPGNNIDLILSTDSTDTESMFSIQINNDGKPIPDDEIDTIFKPFVTHKAGGTGIGLALAKRIIEAHMGSIQVSSSDNLTSFTILLPLPTDL